MKDVKPCSTQSLSEFERQLLKRLDVQESINRRLLQTLTQLTTDIGRYVDTVLEPND